MPIYAASIGAFLVSSAAIASEFKPVDAEDIFIKPRKYIGENIEMHHMGCLYADSADIRCSARGTDAAVAIFAYSIQTAAMIIRLSRDCDTVKKSTTLACEFTVRFAPDEIFEDDARVVLRPSMIDLIKE